MSLTKLKKGTELLLESYSRWRNAEKFYLDKVPSKIIKSLNAIQLVIFLIIRLVKQNFSKKIGLRNLMNTGLLVRRML